MANTSFAHHGLVLVRDIDGGEAVSIKMSGGFLPEVIAGEADVPPS